MTPEIFNSWLLQAALFACMIFGIAMLVVSVRSGWIGKAITWALVSFSLIGALMLLSPKWTKVAFEFHDFKAEIARLEKENKDLGASNARYATQIAQVSNLGSVKFSSAEDVVSTILKTRANVSWADFLPANRDSYRVEVPPTDEVYRKAIEAVAKGTTSEASTVFKDAGLVVLKPATESDLKSAPADALWVTPGGGIMKAPPLK